MKHIELLNDDVSYLETFTTTPCCNTCNSDTGGGGGCTCQTYVCGAANVSCSCGNVGLACDTCNICQGCECGYINFG